MKERNVELNGSYLAISPLLTRPVTGVVIAKNSHTCILRITEYQKQDEIAVWELQKAIVVRYDDLTSLGDNSIDCITS